MKLVPGKLYRIKRNSGAPWPYWFEGENFDHPYNGEVTGREILLFLKKNVLNSGKYKFNQMFFLDQNRRVRRVFIMVGRWNEFKEALKKVEPPQ